MPSAERPPAYARLLERLAELDDLAAAVHLLGWDEQTMMPPGGAAARAEVAATVERVAHERAVDDGLVALLEELQPWAAGLDAGDAAADVVRVARRDADRARRVPSALAAEITRAGFAAMPVWQRAREERDFARFAPALERNLELRRELAACYPEVEHPYDALLDAYEPGMTTADLRALFGGLREGLVPLIASAAASGAPAPLQGPFDVAAQRTLALDLARGIGFDDDHWRLDDAVHPFAQSLAPGDIRVTGRFSPDDLSGLFAVVHEMGHGLYERQVDPALARTTLGTGVSLGIHESQSRVWENHVGRGRPFWSHWLPRAQAALPALDGLDLDGFLGAVNAVRPGPIRVDADETTYALHIVLRFDLEVALLDGDLAVADLPRAWNDGMRELLGVEVAHDAEGVLQDIHWTFGELGYFPAYTLGDVAAAQLWGAARAALPELDARVGRGDVASLRAWLAEHVHRHGRRLDPPELLRRATGRSYDHTALLEHLRARVAAVRG
jgi:carboxypeptidase Taq